MDHQDLVNKFINGLEISIPIEEVTKFNRCLLDTLDAMGNAVVAKPAHPLGIAYVLHRIARNSVLSRTNHREADRALRIALRIFAYLAPIEFQIQSECCRLLAILLAAQGRFQDAQLCDEKAVSLAMAMESTDDTGKFNHQ